MVILYNCAVSVNTIIIFSTIWMRATFTVNNDLRTTTNIIHNEFCTCSLKFSVSSCWDTYKSQSGHLCWQKATITHTDTDRQTDIHTHIWYIHKHARHNHTHTSIVLTIICVTHCMLYPDACHYDIMFKENDLTEFQNSS